MIRAPLAVLHGGFLFSRACQLYFLCFPGVRPAVFFVTLPNRGSHLSEAVWLCVAMPEPPFDGVPPFFFRPGGWGFGFNSLGFPATRFTRPPPTFLGNTPLAASPFTRRSLALSATVAGVPPAFLARPLGTLFWEREATLTVFQWY